jgi:hypothetical protein
LGMGNWFFIGGIGMKCFHFLRPWWINSSYQRPFLRAWVAAVRGSRKLRIHQTQPRRSVSHAQPPRTILRTRIKCRNQTTALTRGEFPRVPTPCHCICSDSQRLSMDLTSHQFMETDMV